MLLCDDGCAFRLQLFLLLFPFLTKTGWYPWVLSTKKVNYLRQLPSRTNKHVPRVLLLLTEFSRFPLSIVISLWCPLYLPWSGECVITRITISHLGVCRSLWALLLKWGMVWLHGWSIPGCGGVGSNQFPIISTDGLPLPIVPEKCW